MLSQVEGGGTVQPAAFRFVPRVGSGTWRRGDLRARAPTPAPGTCDTASLVLQPAHARGLLQCPPFRRDPLNYGVILAGGRGERFWPLSRADRAKQFLPLAGDRTLLAATAGRLAGLVPLSRMSVVTGLDQVPQVRASLPELPLDGILAEPLGRNTAPAVALGAAWALREDPGAVIVVVPSDAWVGEAPLYQAALGAAIEAAQSADVLVTIGVVPTRPETGYGYLELGDPIVPGGPVHAVARFVEKPDAMTAVGYVTGGRHLWNCGIFVMKAAVLLAAVAQHLPELDAALAPLRAAPLLTPAVLDAYYRAAPSISIDYGVMERADNVRTVRALFPWDDLGSWVALERILPSQQGGVVQGEALLLDSPGAVVYSESGLVAAVGAADLVIVRTADATLVVPKSRAQEVRRLVQELGIRDGLRKYL